MHHLNIYLTQCKEMSMFMFMLMFISTYIRIYVFELCYKDNLLCSTICMTLYGHGMVFRFIFLHTHLSVLVYESIRFSFDYIALHTRNYVKQTY